MIQFSEGRWENLDGMGENILREMRPKAERAVDNAGTLFVNELKVTLTGARTGRSYKVSKTGRMHVASAPGEPPAVLYGNLRNSMGKTSAKWDGWTVGVEVGTGLGVSSAGEIVASYAHRLEFGGFHEVPRDVNVQVAPDVWRRVKAGTMIQTKARPYMKPTQDRVEPKITALFEAAL